MNKELPETTNQIEVQYLISANKFIILSFLTLGLYEAWWIYKAWRFFQQKEILIWRQQLEQFLLLFF